MRLVESMREQGLTMQEIREDLKQLNYSSARIWQLTTIMRRSGEAEDEPTRCPAPAGRSPTSAGGRGRDTSLDIVWRLVADGTPPQRLRAALRARGFTKTRVFQLMHHRSVQALCGNAKDGRRGEKKK